jgi:hypothetical protein
MSPFVKESLKSTIRPGGLIMIKDKDLALQLLKEKIDNDYLHTYTEIEQRSGYGKRQLIRMMQELREGKSTASVLVHGNTGRQPVTTASEEEYQYLREFKKPYPVITIAQFRDIFIEDVISNPEMQGDVKKYDLKPRSESWFRQLFLKEGWISPAEKPVRTDGSHVTHPIRKPMAQRGQLLQIDGTDFDWLGTGENYTLHSAVDDATTEILSGSFMPNECMRGYALMMRTVLIKYGKPLSIYSDQHSIFRSVRNHAISQFGMMMQDLGIHMIFAQSSQAKGRIERYNQTNQLRLVNDAIRFKIKDYSQLNRWYNDFYCGYLNRKFSFSPLDPNDAYIEMPEGYDYSKIFRARFERTISAGMFSVGNTIYSPVNEDGEVIHIQNGAKVKLFIDVQTEELYMERYGKRYTCVQVCQRKRSPVEEVENQKELAAYLRKVRGQ